MHTTPIPSAKEEAIRLSSAVLGSATAAALAVLTLDGMDTAALVPFVLVVVVVLGAAVAGFSTGSVTGPARPARGTSCPR